jgi:hypothetical protein
MVLNLKRNSCMYTRRKNLTHILIFSMFRLDYFNLTDRNDILFTWFMQNTSITSLQHSFALLWYKKQFITWTFEWDEDLSVYLTKKNHIPWVLLSRIIIFSWLNKSLYLCHNHAKLVQYPPKFIWDALNKWHIMFNNQNSF